MGFFLQISLVSGQSLRAYYSQIHKTMMDSDERSTEEMILFINTTETIYESYDRIKQRALKDKEASEQAKQSTDDIPTIRMTTGPPRIPYDMVRDLESSVMKITYSLRRFYTYEDKIEKINWDLSDSETKEHLGFVLKKAKGDFRGRKWTAWYAEDIPVQAGPWMLGGLPGLIVQAYDENKEVEFLMNALEDESIVDEWLGRGQVSQWDYITITEVSKDEFFKVRNNMVKNLDAYMLSIRGVVARDSGLLNPKSWSIVPTNPIDLFELKY